MCIIHVKEHANTTIQRTGIYLPLFVCVLENICIIAAGFTSTVEREPVGARVNAGLVYTSKVLFGMAWSRNILLYHYNTAVNRTFGCRTLSSSALGSDEGMGMPRDFLLWFPQTCYSATDSVSAPSDTMIYDKRKSKLANRAFVSFYIGHATSINIIRDQPPSTIIDRILQACTWRSDMICKGFYVYRQQAVYINA